MSHNEDSNPRRSNTLGLIGFIVSLTCCLSPLGLLLSLIGLTRPPRVLAILGVLIGGLGTAFIASAAIKQDRFGYLFGEQAGQGIEYAIDMAVTRGLVENYREVHGELPENLDQLDMSRLERFATDPWGHRYEILRPAVRTLGDERIYLRSAGPDGITATGDDVIFDLLASKQRTPEELQLILTPPDDPTLPKDENK